MICQSWKVMFQAEYSSGSPLRMLVDLRASVEHALGRGKSEDTKAKAQAGAKTAAAVTKPAAAPVAKAAAPVAKPAATAAKAAAAGAAARTASKPAAPVSKAKKPAETSGDAPEFEVSGAPGWDPDASQKKN
jgi:hypothetical protein